MGVDGAANDPNKRKAYAIQRGKGLVPNGHTVRFLYLMLKQIDTRQIDWRKVADGTGIATAASARNRYSRFRKQIESQIDGDTIQAKREQKEEDDTSDSFSFNSIPVRVDDASTDATRRIKTEPGAVQANEQCSRQRVGCNFVDFADDNEPMDSVPISASSTPNIKREKGLYDDFESSLIKREKSVDDETSPSLRNLYSEFYDSSHISPDRHAPCLAIPTQVPVTSTPSLPSHGYHQNIPPLMRRTVPPSSSPPFSSAPFHHQQPAASKTSAYLSVMSSPFLPSSPAQPSLPSQLPQYRAGNCQESMAVVRPRQVTVHPLSPFYIPQDPSTQGSNFGSRITKPGHAGTGSAEEPLDLDD